MTRVCLRLKRDSKLIYFSYFWSTFVFQLEVEWLYRPTLSSRYENWFYLQLFIMWNWTSAHSENKHERDENFRKLCYRILTFKNNWNLRTNLVGASYLSQFHRQNSQHISLETWVKMRTQKMAKYWKRAIQQVNCQRPVVKFLMDATVAKQLYLKYWFIMIISVIKNID